MYDSVKRLYFCQESRGCLTRLGNSPSGAGHILVYFLHIVST